MQFYYFSKRKITKKIFPLFCDERETPGQHLLLLLAIEGKLFEAIGKIG